MLRTADIDRSGRQPPDPAGRRTTCSPTWKKAGFAYTPPANPAYGSDVQLPGADETRIEAELRRLHRTGQRTGIVEMCLPTDGAQRGIRVLCVRA